MCNMKLEGAITQPKGPKEGMRGTLSSSNAKSSMHGMSYIHCVKDDDTVSLYGMVYVQHEIPRICFVDHNSNPPPI